MSKIKGDGPASVNSQLTSVNPEETRSKTVVRANFRPREEAYAIIRESDGELIERIVVREERATGSPAFVQIFQAAAMRMSMDPSLDATHRVAEYLIATVGYWNFSAVTQADIARKLSISGAQVSKSISKLLKSGCLIRIKRDGKSYWKLNAEYGWRGSKRAWTALVGGAGESPVAPDAIVAMHAAEESA